MSFDINDDFRNKIFPPPDESREMIIFTNPDVVMLKWNYYQKLLKAYNESQTRDK